MDADKIRSEGVKLLEEFSDKLKDVPETEETHYVVDLKNVRRPDSGDCGGFREKFLKLAPKTEEGYVVAEKGV